MADTAAVSGNRRQLDDIVKEESVPKRMNMVTEVSFSHDMLKVYYDKLFPFEKMTEWLSYGRDAEFLERREFTFTLENDIFVRYLSFKNATDWENATISKLPERMEIGPVYDSKPKLNPNFKPEERELIFDIDLNDYDDIRTCCVGANICKKCWSFMIVAIRVLNSVLQDDFGFRHILFVYSGRRGVHCHVADERARKLTDEQRSAVSEYINGKSSNVQGIRELELGSDSESDSSKSLLQANLNAYINALSTPLHPAHERAFSKLRPYFESAVVSSKGQGVLSSPKHWNKLLYALPPALEHYTIDGEPIRFITRLQRFWEEESSSSERWRIFQAELAALQAELRRSSKDMDIKKVVDKLEVAIVFSYIYPRLDINVSKHMNHLLKAPFCIHPKTGRVCVPIRYDDLDTFDPLSVPTLSGLMAETSRFQRIKDTVKDDSTVSEMQPSSSMKKMKKDEIWRETSMKPYMQHFNDFLGNLRIVNLAKRRQKIDLFGLE